MIVSGPLYIKLQQELIPPRYTDGKMFCKVKDSALNVLVILMRSAVLDLLNAVPAGEDK